MTFALSRTLRQQDLEDPGIAQLMRTISGSDAADQHRKGWEFAMCALTLEAAGVLHDDAVGLSVAAGHEAIVYYLANRCRQIYATDIYEMSNPFHMEAAEWMLVDPDVFAPYPYRRGRLVVCWMDALDLRFEDDTFDFVVSLGSIEHFGEVDGAARALAEMARVTRPGGVVFVTTEQALDGRRTPVIPRAWLFDPDELFALVADVPSLEWFGEVDFRVPPEPAPDLVDMRDAAGVAPAGIDVLPHLGLRTRVGVETRELTSVSLALRKRPR